MFCNIFLILMCLFIISGTAASPKRRGFYISGYNTSNAINIKKDTIKYKYEKNEVLNLSCHNDLRKPVIWLRWRHNEQNIPGVEEKSIESQLSFNITKSNHKDRLTCYASEDDTGLMENEKKTENMIILILDYVGLENEDTTTSNPEVGDDEGEDTENWFEKLLNTTLFWIVLTVTIVVIVVVAIVIVVSKKTYRRKEDKLTLHPAVSNASVFSTESKTPIIPKSKKANFYTNDTYDDDACVGVRQIINSEYQEPIDSQEYSDPQTYSEPDKQLYAEPIPRILRIQRDNVYVNYNKNNGSANINNQNRDLYQNCEVICDSELNYYTETY